MKNKIYITGHKNPDTDSIASALVYADLKNRIDSENEYVPVRLGELNLESTWVLEQWNQKAPMLVDNLKQTIADLELEKPLCIREDVSIYQAANHLQQKGRTFLPVVDGHDKLIGIVTLSNLTKSYMDVWDDELLGRSVTNIRNIVEVLAGELVYLPDHANPYNGRMLVYASQVDEIGHVDEGDIVIVGNRLDSQREAMQRKAGILIISSGHELEAEILALAKENNVTVIKTKYNSFMAARLLPQAIPVSYVMTKHDLQFFTPDEYLESVSKKVKETRYRNFPIVDEEMKVVGELNRNDLMFDKKKQLILVDHNEGNQSINDRENVDILEIIDHHRVANINTSNPVYFRNMPVGCTATILAMMYRENGLVPSQEMAGLMASAIISDTLLFRSPTTTETDRKILHELATIAKIDLEQYGSDMFAAATSLEGVDAEDILMTDSKNFEINGQNLRVSQAFTTNLQSVDKFIEDIISAMEAKKTSENLDFFGLFITDIFNEQSLVISLGKYGQALAKDFESEYNPKGYIVKGLLSRKKQFIPTLTRTISNSDQDE